jgi:hypothetical protein
MRNNSASPCSETQSCSCHVGSAALSTVSEEMALHALAYNLTHLINFVNIKPLLAAIRA